MPEGTDPAITNDWTLLPFMALSDGAHAASQDYSYFTLRKAEEEEEVDELIEHEAEADASLGTNAWADSDNPLAPGKAALWTSGNEPKSPGLPTAGRLAVRATRKIKQITAPAANGSADHM